MSTIQIPERPSYNQVLADMLNRIRRLEAEPPLAPFHLKVFGDANCLDGNTPESVRIVVAGTSKMVVCMDDSVDGARLSKADAYVTTVGSSDIEIMLRNITQAVNMLTSPIVIAAGEFTSYAAGGSSGVVDELNNTVAVGDLVGVNVVAAGGGVAQGLGVMFRCNG